VIVVRDSDRVRAVLAPVYAALGVAWDPETTGSIEDELGDATCDQVAAALLAELQSCFEIVAPDRPPIEATRRAAELEARFRIESPAAGASATYGDGRTKIAAEGT
jgi:hypothetical protein